MADASRRALSHAMNTAALMDTRDVDELLAHFRAAGWAMHAFPNRLQPEVLAYTFHHGEYTDVVILRGRDQAAAFRVPPSPSRSFRSVLAPDTVVWAWVGEVEPTLRQMFALPGPDDVRAPVFPQPAPEDCGIRPDERERFTYRPARKQDGR